MAPAAERRRSAESELAPASLPEPASAWEPASLQEPEAASGLAQEPDAALVLPWVVGSRRLASMPAWDVASAPVRTPAGPVPRLRRGLVVSRSVAQARASAVTGFEATGVGLGLGLGSGIGSGLPSGRIDGVGEGCGPGPSGATTEGVGATAIGDAALGPVVG
jgi:hypothetical protein